MPQNQLSKLGTTLRTKREELHMSVRKLATEVGVRDSSLLRIESGNAKPKPELLKALADRLGLSLSQLYILAGYPIPGDMSEMTAYLRGKYHELAKEDQEKVDEYILLLHHKHGLDAQGPQRGEDEQ